MRMWALVANRQPLQAMEVETPVPKGSEVLVAVSHCGVCHSDLHLWEGEYNLGFGNVIRLTDRGVTLPRAPGHEVLGRVAALGPEATDVQVGDRRIVYPWIGCGSCARCLAGDDNMCAGQSSIGVVRHGGFGSHVLVPHPRYLVDPGDVDPAVAATFACSGITVLSAIRKLGPMQPDSPVLLIGAGGLGHSAIATLRALDHRRIIVVDLDPAKRQAALDAGATDAVDGRADDVVAAVAAAARAPVLHAIDFVNNSRTARTAFDCLGKGGRLVLVGAAGGEFNLSLAGMIFTAKAVMGSQTGNLQDLRDVVALARSCKLRPIPVERMASERANEALDRLHDGRVTGRLVLERAEA